MDMAAQEALQRLDRLEKSFKRMGHTYLLPKIEKIRQSTIAKATAYVNFQNEQVHGNTQSPEK